MRRVLMVLAVLMAALGLAACGGNGHHVYHRPAHAATTQHRYAVVLPSGQKAVAAHAPGFGRPPNRLVPVAPKSTPTVLMLDTVTPSTMAGLNPSAVAGYTSGFWPTFWPLVSLYPHAYHVSIAVNASHGQVSSTARDCIDSEPGDATPSQAAWWVFWEIKNGVALPCVYASLSDMGTVVADLNADHVSRNQYFLWDADWTRSYHLDAGFDCTQYNDTYVGRNIDPSACTLRFLSTGPPPPPPDPYRIFPKTVYSLALGVHAQEHNTVATWYRFKCLRPVRRPVCKSTYLHVRLLRDREYWVAHHRVVHGRWVEIKRARWGDANLGARFHWLTTIVG